MNEIDPKYLDELKQALWKKAIGNEEVTRSQHYFQRIAREIEKETGHLLHRDTIRNFFDSGHQPRLKTLDILSDYVLGGDTGRPLTFQDFVRVIREKESPPPEEAETPSGPSPRPFLSVPKWLLFFLLFLLLTGLGYGLWCSLQPPPYWVDNFDNVDLPALESRGWRIVDFDPASWRQERPGILTLYTERGDYWYTPPDTPVINNLLIREVSGDCYNITVKLVDFFLREDFQQAGFFLLDENLDPEHSLRITAQAYSRPDSLIVQQVQIIRRVRGVTYENKAPVRIRQVPVRLDSIWLRVEVRDNRQFSFYWHRGAEFNAFARIETVDFPFTPRYVGLAAFRGLRFTDRSINTSESIPAHFDYVRVDACE